MSHIEARASLQIKPYLYGKAAIFRAVLALVAGANILFVVFLWFNHIAFPLNLDLMESTVLQHVAQVASFRAIYPEPSPGYVPLAYNPLYYVLAAPFTWIFGLNLSVLRFVSILATLGSGLLIYRVVRRKTGSVWWGVMALGLFAAAYRVMDAYLDTAHSDAWLLFAVLLGTYLVDDGKDQRRNFVGVLVLIASFWFKQHGAIFAAGGLCYLTWRLGKRSWPYWLVTLALGPLAYLLAGPALFGPRFHYYTWQVGRNWTLLNLATIRRYVAFVVRSYPLLAASAVSLVTWIAVTGRKRLGLWEIQLVAALLAGFMGSLDPGSSNNVYIAVGAWFIILGVIGLHRLAARVVPHAEHAAQWVALLLSFALMFYDPRSVIASSSASASYQDLLSVLRGLHAQVYAPSVGQLPHDYQFYPAAHWVALEDMIRGPGKDETNNPVVRSLLEPAINPAGPAYVLANYPLETYPWIAFLGDDYTLETDFGARFQPLRVLPKRWDHGWPRYLYRYVGTRR